MFTDSFLRTAMEAICFAADMHKDQRRKGTKAPYIIHPLRVAKHVVNFRPDNEIDLETAYIAAILHDTVEDTDTSKEDLIELFGEKVTGVVLELTQDKSMVKEERIELMIEHAPDMSPEAKFVKLCDRYDNVRELRVMGEAFIRRYLSESKRLLANLRGTCAELEIRMEKLIADVEAET
ncbi:MAG: HD domain-containing protein [Planctomycetes bacterium]|nr:HD domain-containing protein [Planctomycetota bacterium]